MRNIPILHQFLRPLVDEGRKDKFPFLPRQKLIFLCSLEFRAIHNLRRGGIAAHFTEKTLMSKGFGGIVETLMSLFVEAGGQSVTKGGGGLLKGAARKIGWASPEQEQGGRLKGHSLGGHSMGAGFGRAKNLGNYNPKTHHLDQMHAQLNRGSRSGSGALPPRPRNTRPTNLFGRSSFEGANTINGDPKTRWVKQGGNSGRNSYAPPPRSFIKFGK